MSCRCGETFVLKNVWTVVEVLCKEWMVQRNSCEIYGGCRSVGLQLLSFSHGEECGVAGGVFGERNVNGVSRRDRR